jgi:hypothetical protein
MIVLIDVHELDEAGVENPSASKMSLVEIGTEAWIRITVNGKSYEASYEEFWDAARAVCIKRFSADR